MDNKKIRLAILGTGPRGLCLAKLYVQHPDIDIVALCDIAEGEAEETARQLKEEFGCETKVFSSYESRRDGAVYDAILIAEVSKLAEHSDVTNLLKELVAQE